MLKRVRIQNFRSLDIDVELDPITVLIGRSGTGKSNFLHALRWLRETLQNGNLGVARGDRNLSASAKVPYSLRFELTFSVPGFKDDFRFVAEWVFASNGTTREELLLGEQIIYKREGSKLVHGPKTASPSPDIGSHFALGRLTGSREATRAFAFLTQSLGYYSFSEHILEKGDKAHSDDDLGGNALVAINAITNDLEHPDNWYSIIDALRTLNPSVYSVELNLPQRNSVTVTHMISDTSLQMQLPEESEGFRRFLAHLVALYQSPRKQALLFEEPEKGIHPGALATLANEFRRCPEEGRGQVILTTHSPQLLDHFDIANIRVVEIENYVTRIRPVSEEQLEAVKEHLLEPGELLTVNLAQGEPVGSAEAQ